MRRNAAAVFAACVCLITLSACDALLVDQTPPTVSACAPADGSTNAAATVIVSVTFSKAMDRETVERAFTLGKDDGETIKGVFAWSGETVTFTPLAPLDVHPEYRIRVATTAEDASGNNLLAEFQASFTVTGRATSPVALWTNPVDGGGTPVNDSDVFVGFSAAMDEASLHAAFSLAPAVPGIVSLVSNGRVLRFHPTTALVWGTRYTLTVSKDARDAAGNPLAEDKKTTFLVGTNFTAPAIVSFATQGGSPVPFGSGTVTNVSKRVALMLAFSKPMDIATTLAAFSLEPAVEGSLTVSGSNLVFTPTTSFKEETTYLCKIAATAADCQGNPLGSERHQLLRVDAADSRYLRVLEVRGPTNELWSQNQPVAITDGRITNMTIQFSAPVTMLSILPAFSVEQYSGTSGSSPGIETVTLPPAGGTTLRLSLRGLAEGGIYKLTITAEGKDIWDNPLATEWIFFFQT